MSLLQSLRWLVLLLYEFDIKILKYFYFFIFFSTIAGYNFVKFVSIYKSSKHEISLSLKLIQLISVTSRFVFLFSTFRSFNGCCPVFLAILTFLYANPLHKNKNLRNLTGLKISIVALVWASTTVVLPILNENIELLNKNVWLSFIQRFLFVFILTLPFEIRDLKFDDSTIETLPQRVGVCKTKLIGTFLLIVVLVLEFFKDEIDKNHLYSLALITPILFLFLLFSKKNEPKYYSSFWVESIPIVWYGLSSLILHYFNISYVKSFF